jgi:thioredoxin 1
MRLLRRSLLAAAVVTTAVSAPSVASAAAPRPADSIDALYVVNAATGSYDGRTLTLHGVAPTVAWFADRPQRASGVEPMRTVTTQLFGGGQAKPNAALDLADDGELAGVAALTLSAPSYNARTRTLTYRASRLPSLSSTKLGHLEAQRSTAKLPRTFHAAALFIDDGEVPASVPLTSAPAQPLAGGGLTTTSTNQEFLDSTNFQTQVIAASAQQPVVVNFCAAWADPCGRANPVLDAEAAKRAGTMTFGRIDVSLNDANAALATQYGIESVPTLVVFENGQVVARHVGASSQAEVDQFLATIPSMGR